MAHINCLYVKPLLSRFEPFDFDNFSFIPTNFQALAPIFQRLNSRNSQGANFQKNMGYPQNSSYIQIPFFLKQYYHNPSIIFFQKTKCIFQLLANLTDYHWFIELKILFSIFNYKVANIQSPGGSTENFVSFTYHHFLHSLRIIHFCFSLIRYILRYDNTAQVHD